MLQAVSTIQKLTELAGGEHGLPENVQNDIRKLTAMHSHMELMDVPMTDERTRKQYDNFNAVLGAFFTYEIEVWEKIQDKEPTYTGEFDLISGLRAVGSIFIYSTDPEWVTRAPLVYQGEGELSIPVCSPEVSKAPKMTARDIPKVRRECIIVQKLVSCYWDVPSPEMFVLCSET
jgi:hypothetical protein